MAKKIAKKYETSRKEIAATLDEVLDRLTGIDTFITTPSDVLDEVTDIAGELESLRERLNHTY